MKISPVVKKETLHVAAGTALLTTVMLLVFWWLGKFDWTVLWGALLGFAFAVGNFFLMGLSIQVALGKGVGAQSFMKSTYAGRMLLYAVCIVLGALLPCFHGMAAIIPLFFPQLVALFIRATGLSKDEAPAAEEKDEQKEEEE
ncbi:MAG: ATP synthase subunit I [Oscillospiraceae bacterium]|nr:ATP synthase subunit I [Oscillospiraceae bacterium]